MPKEAGPVNTPNQDRTTLMTSNFPVCSDSQSISLYVLYKPSSPLSKSNFPLSHHHTQLQLNTTIYNTNTFSKSEIMDSIKNTVNQATGKKLLYNPE